MILELGFIWALTKDWKDYILTYSEVYWDKGRIDNFHRLVGCEVLIEVCGYKKKSVTFVNRIVEFSIREVCRGVD